MTDSTSAVVQHSQEIVTVLTWMLAAGGALFLSIIGWIGNRLFGELQGIKEQIQETNRTLSAIERDLRGDVTDLDRRLTAEVADIRGEFSKLDRRQAIIETKCAGHHNQD